MKCHHRQCLICMRLCRLEVAPHVKGVSGATHKGFATKEEADRAFESARARGGTKIVRDEPNGTRSPRPAGAYPTSPIPSFRTESPRANFQSQSSRQHSSGHSGSFRSLQATPPRPASQTHSPVTQTASPISRSSSEPSSRDRRFQAIQEAFDAETSAVVVEARVPSVQRTPASTSPAASYSSPRSSSGSSGSQYRAVVRTPSWLAPYPKADSVLSPLNDTELKLTFGDADTEVPTRANTPRSLANTTPTPRVLYNSPSEGSVGLTSFYVSSPSTSQVNHDIDPRSPILKESQVPELSYVRLVVFGRLIIWA